jgi:hypothetical protein
MPYKLKRNIALSESGFIFDPSTGDSFSVNGTGLRILEYLRSGLTENEIIDELVKKFNADIHLIREDLDDFINHLKQLKMVVDEVS